MPIKKIRYSRKEIYELIGVQECYWILDRAIQCGIVKLNSDYTDYDIRYTIIDNNKFQLLVEEARAKEAERRLLGGRQLSFNFPHNKI